MQCTPEQVHKVDEQDLRKSLLLFIYIVIIATHKMNYLGHVVRCVYTQLISLDI